MRCNYLKKNLLLVCTATACITTAHADEWLGRDKAKHFAVSAALGAAAYAVTENRNQAIAFALTPGVAKELYDSTKCNNHFSGKDMLWNALGAAVGVQFGFMVIKPNEVSISWRF